MKSSDDNHKKISTELSIGGVADEPCRKVPITEDGEHHLDHIQTVDAGEIDPDEPTEINGKKIDHWEIVSPEYDK